MIIDIDPRDLGELDRLGPEVRALTALTRQVPDPIIYGALIPEWGVVGVFVFREPRPKGANEYPLILVGKWVSHGLEPLWERFLESVAVASSPEEIASVEAKALADYQKRHPK